MNRPGLTGYKDIETERRTDRRTTENKHTLNIVFDGIGSNAYYNVNAKLVLVKRIYCYS